MIHISAFARTLVLFVTITVLGYLIVRQFVFTNFVFNSEGTAQLERELTYYEERRIRNAKSMARSFEDLEQEANIFIKTEEWGPALEALLTAKSIYPENIDVRKNLCYVYMQLCHLDWRYCRYAKREVYYAHRYIMPGDDVSYDYIHHLTSMIDIGDLVDLDEGAALSAIF